MYSTVSIAVVVPQYAPKKQLKEPAVRNTVRPMAARCFCKVSNDGAMDSPALLVAASTGRKNKERERGREREREREREYQAEER